MNPTYDFTDKVALVTGASEGIGFASAQGFAKFGAWVVLSDKNEETLLAAADKLSSHGYRVLAVTCDVSIEAEAEKLVARAVAEFGRIDMAYNNIGILGPWGPITEETEQIFRTVTAANLKGIWACTKHQLIQMEKQGNGSIVNCVSSGTLVSLKDRGAYQSSKYEVLGLTRCAALDFATKNIRVNAVCPDSIETSMTVNAIDETIEQIIREQPTGRLGRSDEVAEAVLWLCSDAASFVLGAALQVDGGFTVYCT